MTTLFGGDAYKIGTPSRVEGSLRAGSDMGIYKDLFRSAFMKSNLVTHFVVACVTKSKLREIQIKQC